MSLEICETVTPEKLSLKDSRFFKNKVVLTIKQGAEFKFTKISDELYLKQKKVYFPIFKNILFVKTSKDNRPDNFPIIFKGSFIEDDEVGMIESVIKVNDEKENKKYLEYKKSLDKELSLIINSMNLEISNQKKYLEKDNLTKSQYNQNIKTLVNAYNDIIMIKLSRDLNLRNDDRNGMNRFYGNMIAGLADNNIKKEILIDLKDSEIKNDLK
jgi:hypothetical protein